MKGYTVLYEPGDVVELSGELFLILDVEHRSGMPDSIFMITLYSIESAEFGDSGNYAKSNLKKSVDKWLKKLEKGGFDSTCIIPRDIDLTTVDGYAGYGKLAVSAAPLTIYEIRKYAGTVLLSDDSYWLSTGLSGPCKCNDSCNTSCNTILYINDDGICCSCSFSNSHGVRPALKVSANIFDEPDDGRPDLGYFSTDDLLEEIRKRMKLQTIFGQKETHPKENE